MDISHQFCEADAIAGELKKEVSYLECIKSQQADGNLAQFCQIKK